MIPDTPQDDDLQKLLAAGGEDRFSLLSTNPEMFAACESVGNRILDAIGEKTHMAVVLHSLIFATVGMLSFVADGDKNDFAILSSEYMALLRENIKGKIQ